MPISLATTPPPSQFRLALTGLPGSRKTTILLHFALFEALRGKSLYIADLDGNMTTALGVDGKEEKNRIGNTLLGAYPDRKFQHEGKEYQFNILYTDIPAEARKSNAALSRKTGSFTQEKLMEVLESEIDAVMKMKDVGVIAIDSQTVLNKIILDSISKGGTEGMTRQKWGEFMADLQRLIFAVRATDKIVIWTAHELPEYRDLYDAKGNVIGHELTEFVLNIPGQVKHQFSAFFSDTWTLDYEYAGGKPKWSMRTHPTSMQVHVKNSLNLPEKIDLPNDYKSIFPTLWQYLGPRYPRV
jgi:hypothetical protein